MQPYCPGCREKGYRGNPYRSDNRETKCWVAALEKFTREQAAKRIAATNKANASSGGSPVEKESTAQALSKDETGC